MRLVRTAAALAVTSIVGAFATVAVPTPAAAGGGCHTPPTEGTGSTVELSNLCMSPTVLRAGEGTTVTFVNRDAMEHNVSGNSFYTDFAKAGDTWQYRFTESGTYAYACLLHPGMTGARPQERCHRLPPRRTRPVQQRPGGRRRQRVAFPAGVLGQPAIRRRPDLLVQLLQPRAENRHRLTKTTRH